MAECTPCSGSGKRHSIFDFCNCEPECEGLGVCAACNGSGRVDLYQRVQDFIDSCTDVEKQVAILRLCRQVNNGDEHFDHGEPGYSWCCLRCARGGGGALNGWIGALRVLGGVNGSGRE
jgi:hypothetical protein